MEEYEFLFDEETRYCVFPIKYDDIWREYKKQLNSFWTAEVIDYTADKSDWNKLNKDEKYFIEHILAFFAGSDGIVLENLITDFCNRVTILEVQYAYRVQAMIETIHCASGKTLILTDKGYFPIKSLVNQWVNVWNGNEFSNVEVKYTGNSPIYKVTLSNGMDLECTPGHKWLIKNKQDKIETKDLKIGDNLLSYELPTVDIPDIDEFKNPYIHGFFCGDEYAVIKNGKILFTRGLTNFVDVNSINKPRYEVPINYSLTTKIRWLEGFINGKGVLLSSDHTFLQFSDSDLNLLKNIQLLLTTLGIHSKIIHNEFTKNYIFYINSLVNVNKLIKFIPDSKMLMYYGKIKDVEVEIEVKEIIKISDNEETYCFNEPKNHTGIFNGILTGQSETYALLINTYIDDEKRKNELFNAIKTIDCVKKKADWALKWIDVDQKFSVRLLAFSIVEGIFFSGSFCAIFWLKSRGLMVKALGTSNELIARDESMHVNFAILLYSKIKNKISSDIFYTMLRESVEIETNFICESLSCRLIGMNSDLMKQYIEYVADRLSVQLGYEKIYKSENPFDFMNDICLDGKSNFFEKRVTEYRLAVHEGSNDFVLDENF